MDRIVIVTKRTRFRGLVREHLTEGAAQFALTSQGESIRSYKDEDAVYQSALSQIRRQIPNDVQKVLVERADLPNFLFRDSDLVLVCGPDGLFANVAQYVGDQLVLTVNPDPRNVDGVLMLFSPEAVGGIIASVQSGKHQTEALPFVKATIGRDQVLYGINDVFIGRLDQISARYEITFDGRKEPQSSSGVIVSTGVGSTGWMRSVVAMVDGLTGGGMRHRLSSLPEPTADEFVFVVREPFPSPNTRTSIVTGRIVPGRPLVVSSEMPDGGYIFSDGVTEKAIAWNAGTKVTVSVGDRYVQRIVP